jgi:hypothetical protein
VRWAIAVMGSAAFKARGGSSGDMSRMGSSWVACMGLLSSKKKPLIFIRGLQYELTGAYRYS